MILRSFLRRGITLLLTVVLLCACAACGGPTAPPDSGNPDNGPDNPTNVPVTGITISGSDAVTAGATLQLSAAVTPDNATNKAVTWSVSSGSDCASIDQNGLLTATKAGSVTVTVAAQDGSGISATFTVTVKAPDPTTVPVSGITVSGGASVTVGATLQLSAAVTPDNATNKAVTWSVSSGSDCASIDQNGLLTATKAGSVTVTATAQDGSGISATYTVTVQAAPATEVKVTGITISGGNTVTAGATLQLSAAVTPANATNKAVTWSVSSGSDKASIDQNGLLTAKAAGSVTVKATAKDGSGVSATFSITVKAAEPTSVKVSSITISGGTSVTAGKTLQLSAAVAPANAANKAVSWSISSGSSYASIDQNGLLTAKAAGSVTVKVTAQDGSGKSATYKVTVKAAASTALWEGAGTKSNPYLIKTLTDLKNLTTITGKSGYYFKQAANIDAASAGDWVIIGTEDKPFRHHYDGGGFAVSNLTIGNSSSGLISVAQNATFQNVRLENVRSSKYNNAVIGQGGLVGRAIACSFTSCRASVDLRSGSNYCGGLVGYALLSQTQTNFIKDCHVSGTITGGECTGGLVGGIDSAVVEDAYPDYGEPKASVTNCSSSVAFQGASGAYAGGLIGCANHVKIEHCYATGNVTSFDYYVGGLVGGAEYNCRIAYCYATGDVTCTRNKQYGGAFAGGLIGELFSLSRVHDCYATGDIFAPSTTWSDCQDLPTYDGGPWLRYRNPCGSLIGCVEIVSGEKMYVYNCYATGTVSAPLISESDKLYCHGALVGCFYDNYTRRYVIDTSKKDQSDWAGFSENCIGKLENNYNIEALRTYYQPLNYFERTSGAPARYTAMPKHEYVKIITSSQLKQQSTFAGWDFSSVWKMGTNGPELR